MQKLLLVIALAIISGFFGGAFAAISFVEQYSRERKRLFLVSFLGLSILSGVLMAWFLSHIACL